MDYSNSNAVFTDNWPEDKPLRIHPSSLENLKVTDEEFKELAKNEYMVS